MSLTRLFQPLVEDGNDKVTKRDNTTLTQTVYKDSIPPVFGTRNTIFPAIEWPWNKRERINEKSDPLNTSSDMPTERLCMRGFLSSS